MLKKTQEGSLPPVYYFTLLFAVCSLPVFRLFDWLIWKFWKFWYFMSFLVVEYINIKLKSQSSDITKTRWIILLLKWVCYAKLKWECSVIYFIFFTAHGLLCLFAGWGNISWGRHSFQQAVRNDDAFTPHGRLSTRVSLHPFAFCTKLINRLSPA